MYAILTIIGILSCIFALSFLLTTSYKLIDDELIIRSGFSKIVIPIDEITEIRETDNYSKEETDGTACYYISNAYYGNPDRVLICTKTNKSYFAALNNSANLIRKFQEHQINC